MYIEDNNTLAATAGTVIDNKYILWTTWKNGEIYRLEIDNNYIEKEKVSNLDLRKDNTCCCMLKGKDKIFLVSMFDYYEISEYDYYNKKINILLSVEEKGVNIYNSFLINEKIYIFPNEMNKSICVYSLCEKKVDFIEWKDLVSDKFLIKNDFQVFCMDSSNQKIYGTIQKTPFWFEIDVSFGFTFNFFQVKDTYKLSSINICDNIIYFTVYDDEKVLYIRKENEIEEIELLHENENSKEAIFSNVIKYEENLFFIPAIRNKKIQVYNMKTRKKTFIEYPHEFIYMKNDSRIFWQPIILGEKAYFLPHTGNGILVLNLNNMEIFFAPSVKRTLSSYLNKMCIVCEDKKYINSNIGKQIYKSL